jgi:hypothetical protein
VISRRAAEAQRWAARLRTFLTMLIYLDTNIVQYIADHEEFIFGAVVVPQTKSGLLWKELKALRALIQFELEIEQLEVGNMWQVAAPAHLMKELLAGKPTNNQRRVYSLLREAWFDSDWRDYICWSHDQVALINASLGVLNIKQYADRRHIAEAIALRASWFLTNDKDIIKKTRRRKNEIGTIEGVRVARPSECLRIMSDNPSIGWSEHLANSDGRPNNGLQRTRR